MSEHDLSTKKLGKSVLSGITWQYASVFSQAFLNLLVLGTLSRLLSPEDFGVMGTATIFVGLAEMFSELGVGPGIIQHKDLTNQHIRVGFTIAVILGAVMVLILWGAAPLIAIFFKNNDLISVLNAISLAFIIRSFGVVSEGLLRRKLKFKRLMWINLASYTFGYAFAGITLSWGGYGVWALVGATLSQSFLKSGFMLLAAPHSLKPSFSRQELREMVHFGGGVTLARIFNYSANQGDYFVVGRLLGAGPLGIYNRAYRLMMLPGQYFGQALDGVLFPVMAKFQSEKARLTKGYLTGIAMIGLVMSPVGVLMVILAPELVNVVLGSQWTEAVLPFQILAIGVLPRVSYKIDNSLARAMGAVYQRSVRDLIYAVAVILGALIGLRWGLPGVATGVLGALALNNLMALQMSLRLLNCSVFDYIKAQAPGVLLAAAVAVIAVPARLLFNSLHWPAFFTLAATSLICGLILVAFFFWKPQKILGIHGTNALVMFYKAMPSRLLPGVIVKWYNTKIVQEPL